MLARRGFLTLMASAPAMVKSAVSDVTAKPAGW